MTITTARRAFFSAALSTPLSDQASEINTQNRILDDPVSSVDTHNPTLTQHTPLEDIVVDHGLPIVLLKIRLPIQGQVVVLQSPVGEDLTGHDVIDPVGLRTTRHMRTQQVDVGLTDQPIAPHRCLQLFHRLLVLDRKAETGNVDRARFPRRLLIGFRKKPLITYDPNDS